MTLREQIKALQDEVAAFREQMATLQAGQVIHHHHYPPTRTPSGDWQWHQKMLPSSPTITPFDPFRSPNTCQSHPTTSGGPLTCQ